MLIGQSQEKIPKAGRIEDVGVEQRRGKGHRLLQAELLIHGSQFVQRLAATGFGLAAVVKDGRFESLRFNGLPVVTP